MSNNSPQFHYIKLWLRSIDKPLVFPVAEAAWGRFRRSYRAKKNGFFIFATRDGRTLALNLGYVQLAHVWEESEEKVSLSTDINSDVALYFPCRAVETFAAGDPVDLAKIFSALKPSEEDQTLSFADADGKLVMFSTGDLMLFEAPTDVVEEGYRQIYYQERGTLPPR